jgi:uncharacterized protein YxeA
MKTAIVLALIVIAGLFVYQDVNGSTALYTKGKVTVEKFEDKTTKATCYVLSNGNGLSCVK